MPLQSGQDSSAPPWPFYSETSGLSQEPGLPLLFYIPILSIFQCHVHDLVFQCVFNIKIVNENGID